jgi:uncharacterized membrane protein YesL
MRAFLVAARAVVAFYNDLFVYISMSLLWWITGGFFVAVAAVVGLMFFVSGGPWWIAPVLAIPAGPAIMAITAATRQTRHGRAADRHDYLDAFRANWKAGLLLTTLGMVVLSLLLLNLIFYAFQTTTLLRVLSVVWGYLVLFWVSMQFYIYPFHQALEHPSLGHSLRMSALATLANPLFSVLLLLVAFLLTAVSAVLVVLLVIAWPGLMALTGEYGLQLLLDRAGVKQGE